jgi:hypothetical protein
LRSIIFSTDRVDTTPSLDEAMVFHRRPLAANAIGRYLSKTDWRVAPIFIAPES